MKIKIFIILLLVFTLFSSCEQTHTYQFENILFECVKENYQKEGIDIEKEITDFESFLIKNKLLKSSSGESYMTFYKNLCQTNSFLQIGTYQRIEKFSTLKLGQYYSEECLTTLSQIPPPISQIGGGYYELLRVMHRFKSGNYLDLSDLIEPITCSEFLESDFENPYYKTACLSLIAQISNPKLNLYPTNIDRVYPDYTQVQVINVNLTENSQIILNNSTVSKKVLLKELKLFIFTNPIRHMVELQANKDVSYAFYIEILKSIKNVYTNLRNEAAKELYKKNYIDLGYWGKEHINRYHPMHIQDK